MRTVSKYILRLAAIGGALTASLYAQQLAAGRVARSDVRSDHLCSVALLRCDDARSACVQGKGAYKFGPLTRVGYEGFDRDGDGSASGGLWASPFLSRPESSPSCCGSYSSSDRTRAFPTDAKNVHGFLARVGDISQSASNQQNPPADGQDNKSSATQGSPKHIFLVVPAFHVTYQKTFKPLTQREKFDQWLQGTYDPRGIGLYAFEAATLEYSSKDGFCGYGKEELNFLAVLVKANPSPRSSPAKSVTKHVGLARALSKLGFCSRSNAFELIREGKVRLNGSITRNPEAPVRLGKDRIEIEGKPLAAAQKLYFMLNKPRGIITSASDEQGRITIYSILPQQFAPPAEADARASEYSWIAPVGRLDQASEGLLLLTNDSEWGARITDPESHLDKTYHVQINSIADDRVMEALQHGVEISKGGTLKAKRVGLLRSGEKNSWLEIVLDEGKNRQIRRMLDALGVEVLRLIRVSIGSLQLGDLPKGAHRALRPEEKLALDRALSEKRGAMP